jgi:flagellar motor switch protein FliN/FliY
MVNISQLGNENAALGCCPSVRSSDNNQTMAVIATTQSPDLSAKPDVNRIMKLEVPVIVKLAERKLPVAEVLRLGVGSIIEFVKSNDEPLQLMINNRTIAVGEAVKVGENFGLRIKQVGTVRQLIAALGSGLR